jgi:hypothetical protein
MNGSAQTPSGNQRGDYAVSFRILGCLSVLAGIICFLLFSANAKAKQIGGHDISSIIYFSFFFIPVGIGLLFLWRVAAVLLSVPTAILGIYMIGGSIISVPFPWLLLNILLSILLLFPSWATWRRWSDLR